ncbi:MAG: TonB-dependent receptor [Fulvivirga sp.]
MRYILGFLLTCIASVALAQSVVVTGQVMDKDNNPLPSASTVLINASDSIMQSFTIADNEGNFLLKKINKGSYILQVAFVGYETLSKPFTVSDQKESIDLGQLKLMEKTEILDGVSVSADRIPIMINGDTIEYNADAFKTQPNATVEELLKRLPGVEVDQDGNIKAQGEKVNKVFVDGKEFFGDDPKIATKNLPADAINKVQVFDKMSDMAEFTGVDDGERSKTINLDLKDDKKNGVFGKVAGGYGTDDRFQGKASINKFNKKTQLSALAATNNINEQNFSFQDYIGFSGGLSALSGGGMMMSVEGVDGGMGGQQGGVSTATSGGINFNHDFSKSTEFTSSYFFNGIDNTIDQTSARQNFLNGSIYNSGDTSYSTSNNINHRLTFKLEHKINDGQDITLRSNIKLNNGSNRLSRSNQTYDASDALLNESYNNNNGTSDNVSFDSRIAYRKKLNDIGRLITANATVGYGNTVQNQNILSTTSFYGNNPNTINLDQFQDMSNDAFDYNLRVAYTEPLGNLKFLSAIYERQNYDTENKSFYFDNVGTDRIRNDKLSQLYRRDYFYDQGGFKLQMNGEDLTFSAGVMAQSSNLKGKLINEDVKINKNFFNVLPSMDLRYSFARSKSLSLGYSTSVNEPSVRQLQPVVDNSNPLNIYIGNPDLKTEYMHNAYLNFSLFDNFSFTNLFARLNTRLVQNRITNTTLISDDLTQTVSPTNINEEWSGNGYFSFGTSVKPLGIKFHISTSHTYTKTQLFINDQKNGVERFQNSIDFNVENRKKNAVDVVVGYKTELNDTKYSESDNLNQSYFRNVLYSDLSLTFLKTWNLGSSFDYRIFDGDAFEKKIEMPIWRMHLAKTFLKNDRGELKLSVYDLLNKISGVSRTSNFNYIQDQRINVVTQYAMLTFTYSLSKFGGDKSGIVIKEGHERR